MDGSPHNMTTSKKNATKEWRKGLQTREISKPAELLRDSLKAEFLKVQPTGAGAEEHSVQAGCTRSYTTPEIKGSQEGEDGRRQPTQDDDVAHECDNVVEERIPNSRKLKARTSSLQLKGRGNFFYEY